MLASVTERLGVREHFVLTNAPSEQHLDATLVLGYGVRILKIVSRCREKEKTPSSLRVCCLPAPQVSARCLYREDF